MIGKIVGYLYTQTSQMDCFRRAHKILPWIRSSDFNIFDKVVGMIDWLIGQCFTTYLNISAL